MSVGKTKNNQVMMNQKLAQDEAQKAQMIAHLKSECVKLRYECTSYELKVQQIQANISYQQHEIQILQYNKAQRQAQILNYEQQLKKLDNKPKITV